MRSRRDESGTSVVQTMLVTAALLYFVLSVVQFVMWTQGRQEARSAAFDGAETAALADATDADVEDAALDSLARTLVGDPRVTVEPVEVDTHGTAKAVVRVRGSSVKLIGFPFPIDERGRYPMEPR